MAQATIYLGQPELLKSISADVEAHAKADYVQVYHALVQALHAGNDITIAVSEPTVYNWLNS